MILEWRNELQKDANYQINKAGSYWNEKFVNYEINHPEIYFGKFLKTYGLIEVLDCIDISYRQYFKGNKDTAFYALQMLGGILYNRSKK